jgi:hypothetical protein
VTTSHSSQRGPQRRLEWLTAAQDQAAQRLLDDVGAERRQPVELQARVMDLVKLPLRVDPVQEPRPIFSQPLR